MLYNYFSFKRTSGQFNSKDLWCMLMEATLKKQATMTFLWKFYAFHFWSGSLSVGITFTIQFFQVQLNWSCWIRQSAIK